MKLLLLGRNGQVGWELQRSLQPLGTVVALASRAADNPDQLCGDLSDLEGLRHTVRTVRPDVIVNAGAYTAVDKAQTEVERASAINAQGPIVLAEEASRLNAWLLHFSTDYVFNGEGTRAWTEADSTGPLSVYGSTKLQGEMGVQQCPRHLIFRTSWVYAARGGNFAKTMLRLAAERDRLQVVSDQIGAPTGADLLADISAHALRAAVRDDGLAGLYHCVAAGQTSWLDYAKAVVTEATSLGLPLRAKAADFHPIATAQYPTPAQRPLNSRLDTQKLQRAFGLALPHWSVGVQRLVQDYVERNQK